ncbi:MAG: hypothetical protein H8E98_06115 [Bacteroidetes bacterium]|nr:hypothetical protein [Bacteroidota bacterium]
MKKERKIVSFNIKKEIADKLNDLTRHQLPNKSKMIEELLEEWMEKIKNQKTD